LPADDRDIARSGARRRQRDARTDAKHTGEGDLRESRAPKRLSWLRTGARASQSLSPGRPASSPARLRSHRPRALPT
jgi:hypothetical protein